MVSEVVDILRTTEIVLGWILVGWIMWFTIHTQRRLSRPKHVSHKKLLKSFRNQTIAFGFSLIALAQLTTVAALNYPESLGILVFAINVPIIYLVYKAKQDLEGSLGEVRKRKR